jgi:dihydroorotate dehydrogenase
MRAHRYFPSDWVWFAFVGMGLFLSGFVACLVATNRVILPYDEALTGLSPARLAQINPRLLDFMAHDRVAFGGTLVSIGLLYAALAVCGVRAKISWARRALALSAAIGFASYFLWLGFGYFDPIHALATGAIFVCFMLAWGPNGRLAAVWLSWKRLPAFPRLRGLPDPRDLRLRDLRLRVGHFVRALRPGQLIFMLIGGGMVAAGLAIAAIGVTVVFVPEDLQFMHTTAAQLHAASPHLVPLIAHDRAGFGGALVTDGAGVLLAAWWGYQAGARWLWWTFMAAGLPGFAAAIGTHFVVGYLNWWHLFPALLAAGVYLVGLAISYPDLCRPTIDANQRHDRAGRGAVT